jgi:S-adenosylmethionine:tRNA ribosyltransferase-isomerase
MKLEDIDYELPEELIAYYPLKERDKCKLLVYNRFLDKIEHRIFYEIIDYLNPEDVLVFNNTKVFNARLFGLKKETGAKLEILLLKKIDNNIWEALIKPAKRVKFDTEIIIDKIVAKVINIYGDGRFLISFNRVLDYKDINKIGNVPIPPYIKREVNNKIDKKFYQTVYAEKPGSVAAPTAGFHFTNKLIRKIKNKGVKIAFLTLHLSFGSFEPIKSEEIEKHKMLPEYLIIDKKNVDIINNRRGRLIAVGTSTTRALEFLANKNGKIEEFSGEVNNFIYPGYKFKIVQGIITNFHLPKTSLILLVSAFVGLEKLKELYKIAIENKYRFYTYGDAMLIL